MRARLPGPDGATLHASAVVLGEAGILIRGPSGAGKSTVARELVADAERAGGFARLVADDRVRIVASGSRLVARPVAAIAGWIEVRGVGPVRMAHEPAAILRLVVDLEDAPSRLPEAAALHATIAGVTLPRIAVNASLAPGLTRWRLACLHGTLVTAR